eukprot:Phypoly_transcript_18713.p1 GENE.Phypoly_transcript_18713~~Phypoly_transcript_18713.p1  ORF type:complete len:139 (+),score=6.28 Phypoly_transcript_18713:290-706(+)
MGEECEPCRPNTCKNFTIIPPECSKGSTNIGSCDVQPALVPFPDGSVNALVTNYYNGYPDQNCSGEVVGVEYQYFNVCNYVPMFGGAWSLFLPYNNDTTTRDIRAAKRDAHFHRVSKLWSFHHMDVQVKRIMLFMIGL